MAFITTLALTPGTPEWAEHAPGFLAVAVRVILRELALVPQLAHDLENQRVWELAPCGASNWEEFCRDVLKVDPRFLAAVLKLARTHDALCSPGIYGEAGDVTFDAGLPNSSDAATPEATPVLVDRLLVDEWIVLAVARVWRGAATTAASGERERALRTLARIHEVAAAAGIDLRRVEVDDDGGRLVELAASDDGVDVGLAWGLATAEREIRDLIARDARRPTKAKRARSAAARSRR